MPPSVEGKRKARNSVRDGNEPETLTHHFTVDEEVRKLPSRLCARMASHEERVAGLMSLNLSGITREHVERALRVRSIIARMRILTALQDFNDDEEKAANFLLTNESPSLPGPAPFSLLPLPPPPPPVDSIVIPDDVRPVASRFPLLTSCRLQTDYQTAIERSLKDSHQPHVPLVPLRSIDIPAGLQNVGNTCYVNSLLQAYFAIPAFREHVLTFSPTPVPDAGQSASQPPLSSQMSIESGAPLEAVVVPTAEQTYQTNAQQCTSSRAAFHS